MVGRSGTSFAIILIAISSIADAGSRRHPSSAGIYGPYNQNWQWNSTYYRPWYGNVGHTARPRLYSGYNNPSMPEVWPRYSGANLGFDPVGGFGFRGVPARSGNIGLSPQYNNTGGLPIDVPTLNLATDGRNGEYLNRGKAAVSPAGKDSTATAKPPRVNTPSTAEAIARSERKQQLGDELLKKLDYSGALGNYRAAILIAPDRAEPKFRLGIVHAAMGEFPDAVEQFQRGLEIDAKWTSRSPALNELIGAENTAEKSAIQNRAADWVKEDIRDADRLFLMGVLLHLDRNKQAAVFFDTAYKLAGEGPHLVAFLRPASGNLQPVASTNGASTSVERVPVDAVKPVTSTVEVTSPIVTPGK